MSCLAGSFFTTEPPGKPIFNGYLKKIFFFSPPPLLVGFEDFFFYFISSTVHSFQNILFTVDYISNYIIIIIISAKSHFERNLSI